MNSCLYDCRMIHHRIKPKEHRFGYRLFMFYLDLDEIDSIAAKIPWISRNRFNIYAFNDADHVQEGADTVKGNVLRYLEQHDLAEESGKIYLLTHLRTWGHVFNPVSFYFVEDKNGKPLCMIAEVANTFKEQKLYLVTADKLKDGTYRDAQKKYFYISPFSDLDTTIQFRVRPPQEKLALSINETEENKPFFFSSLKGKEKALNKRNLLFYTVFLPFITLQVVLGIHWHALKLYLKKIPVRAKSNRPDLQRDTRPYLKAH